MTMIAHNLQRTNVIRKNKNILVIRDEMSSEVYCWQEVCATCGARLMVVDFPRNQEETEEEPCWTKEILDRIRMDGTTIGVVCVPQVHWSDGSLIDLELVSAKCAEYDIKLVVDGTQSVGIHPFSVREIPCDALAVSVHKWLLGPVGMSLVYINPKWHTEWMPLDQHERSRVAFQDDVFDAMPSAMTEEGYPSEFVDGAARCDGGGKKNPVLMPMTEEALKIVNGLNLEDARDVVKRITDQIEWSSRPLGFSVRPGPRASHIIGLRPGTPKLKALLTPDKMVSIVKTLREKGVYIVARSGAFRIAPYLNTSFEDVDRLITCLAEECIEAVEK
mmetsp:Transcript_28607/g.34910  ORF Transcript_28607/g.34910 Transcript_28607/m.34910 type:complete len:332 (+) Transcript_28607:336-1331(+)